ncbi:MAG: hypothetical protein ACK595_18070, partial [Planctomycetota bacterium]
VLTAKRAHADRRAISAVSWSRADEGRAARRAPQLQFVLLPTLRLPCSPLLSSALLCSVLSVFSVVVLLMQQQQQQKGTTESTENTEHTEDTEARHREPSSKQHPGDAVQRVAARGLERACAA